MVFSAHNPASSRPELSKTDLMQLVWNKAVMASCYRPLFPHPWNKFIQKDFEEIPQEMQIPTSILQAVGDIIRAGDDVSWCARETYLNAGCHQELRLHQGSVLEGRFATLPQVSSLCMCQPYTSAQSKGVSPPQDESLNIINIYICSSSTSSFSPCLSPLSSCLLGKHPRRFHLPTYLQFEKRKVCAFCSTPAEWVWATVSLPLPRSKRAGLIGGVETLSIPCLLSRVPIRIHNSIIPSLPYKRPAAHDRHIHVHLWFTS
jgi:hypothetical protein